MQQHILLSSPLLLSQAESPPACRKHLPCAFLYGTRLLVLVSIAKVKAFVQLTPAGKAPRNVAASRFCCEGG